MKLDNKTSFKKLIIGLIFGNVGFYVASIVPTALLLTLKFLEINKEKATYNFGITTAIGGIATLIFGYVAGIISDRTRLKFGKRKTWILGGSIISAVGLVIIGLTNNITIIIFTWLFTCIGFCFVTSSLNGALADQCESSKRGTAGGIVGIFAPISIQIGIAIMNIINNAPISVKFNVLAVIGVVSAIISCCILDDSPAENIKVEYVERKTSFYPSIKKNPEFSWTVFTRFFMAMAYASQTYMSLYFAMQFNIPENEISKLILISGLAGASAGAIASIAAGVISDKIKKQKPILIIGAILAAVGLAMLAFAKSILMVMVAVVIINVAYSAYLGVNMALSMRILPDKESAAKDMSIINTAGNLPNSIVPACATKVLGLGGYELLFTCLSVCAVVSALSVVPIPEIGEEQVEFENENLS